MPQQEELVRVKTDEKKRLGWYLAGLVLTAVLLRIGLALALPRVMHHDEPSYLLLGRDLLTGKGFTNVHYGPLYPIVSGLLYLLVGDLELASDTAYALFGGLLLFPVFVIVRRIYGVQTAWLAAVLLAIFPALTVSVLYWGTMTEPLYLCLLYGGLAAFLIGIEDNRERMFAAAGTLFGLAYLTRPEAVLYFGVLLVFGLGLGLQVGTRSLRTWQSMGWFTLAFVLLAAPYIFHLHAQTGHWMLTGKLEMTWELSKATVAGDLTAFDRAVNSLDATETEVLWYAPDRFKRNLLQLILADPDEFVQRVVTNVRELRNQFFDWYIFPKVFLPLIIVGLFKAPWDRKRLVHEAFLMASLLPLVSFLVFFIDVRFFAPALPVLLMWAAQGALNLGSWLQNTVELCYPKPLFGGRVRTMLRWLPAAMAALFLIIMLPVVTRARAGNVEFGKKKAGLWLKEHTPSNTKVMTKHTEVVFYADRFGVPWPHADWPSLLKFARNQGAAYLVFDDSLARRQPQLAFLLETATRPPELELVYRSEEPGSSTFVYQITFPTT